MSESDTDTDTDLEPTGEDPGGEVRMDRSHIGRDDDRYDVDLSVIDLGEDNTYNIEIDFDLWVPGAGEVAEPEDFDDGSELSPEEQLANQTEEEKQEAAGAEPSTG
jgi:hypothetical protein